jgi:hypothetical protein
MRPIGKVAIRSMPSPRCDAASTVSLDHRPSLSAGEVDGMFAKAVKEDLPHPLLETATHF